jgi:hypothetical protein
LLIPVAALIAIHPLILHGCSCGHDFDFHLLNWFEAAQQFLHGNLHPHWAYTPAFDAGEPRFVFYPPISWYLGAILGLILTHLPRLSESAAWTATPILFTWIALTLSGFTLHRLARTFASSNAALVAAVLYLANPYMLFTAYERTAYAELLAAAWIPLLLLGILRARVTVPGIAIPLALLWLTNAPAAVMGTYTLAFLALFRIVTELGAPGLASETWESGRKGTFSLKILAATLLGLTLPASYLIPAAYERRYVQIAMATIAGMRIDENFLFHHTGTSSDAILHDQVLHTASVIAIILLAATTLALAVIRATKPGAPATDSGAPGLESQTWESNHRITLPLTLLTVLIAFLLTPWSNLIWRYAPQLNFLQFPWRLLAILAPVTALAAAIALTRFTEQPGRSGAPSIAVSSRWVGRKPITHSPWTRIILAFALTIPGYYAFRQRCFPEDTATARLSLFHSNLGTDPTDEYTPIHADNESLAPANPPFWLAATPGSPHPQLAARRRPHPQPARLPRMAHNAEWSAAVAPCAPRWTHRHRHPRRRVHPGRPLRPDPRPDPRRRRDPYCLANSLAHPAPPATAQSLTVQLPPAAPGTSGTNVPVSAEYPSNSPASMSKYHPCSASVPASTRSRIHGNDIRLSSESEIAHCSQARVFTASVSPASSRITRSRACRAIDTHAPMNW